MRLVTRSDFDGLVCAVLLKEHGIIDDYRFVHPKDVQDGKVTVTENDVLANIPYAPGCGLWFDHHSSEEVRGVPEGYRGSFKQSPSCASVIWEYYGGRKAFDRRFDAMMQAVDRCDSAALTVQDIENPQGWVLLNYVMDPRTGLGRFKDYRISNYQLMMDLAEHCRTKRIEEILDLPDVRERVERYHEQNALFREMIRRCATQYDNVLVVDLRNEEEVFAGNRFVVYTMFPETNVSIRVIWGVHKQNVVLTCGHSIINRAGKADVGALMLEYGGGGHRAVGTCQVPAEDADRVLRELVERMREPVETDA